MNHKTKYKLAKVTWTDSHGATSGWRNIDDYTPSECTVLTAGYLIKETDTLVLIAGSVAEETEETAEQANGVITIPKACIIKLTFL